MFGKAEVDQSDMSIGIQEDIFGFQIAVNDAFGIMEELDRQGDFGRIKLGGVLVESSRSSKVTKYFASGAVIKLERDVSNDDTKNSCRQNGFRGYKTQRS